MKKIWKFPKVLLVLSMLITLISNAQQQFIHVASKANNYCNGNCTTLDVPDLNNNPAAIIWVTPIPEDGRNINTHPIGVYYSENKWRIFNWDQAPMPAGAKFKVEYSATPDQTHFKYIVNNDILQPDGSALIDHPALNNNPTAQFQYLLSWNPAEQRGTNNRNEVKTEYNTIAGKWAFSNLNKKSLYRGDSYNIIISGAGNTVTDPAKATTDISIKNPKTIINTGIIVPVTDKPLDRKDIITKAPPLPSYDFSNVQICIEQASNKNLPPKTAVAIKPVIPKIKPNGELDQVSTITQPLSGATEFMWQAGDTISVGFFPATSLDFSGKVKKYVKEWETYANVTFNFITDVSKARIKVRFNADNSSWSWIGRNVLVNPNNAPTMNFGWFTTNTPDSEFRRTILHEFGHTLGFIHEHQAPTAGIAWDREKVYAFYRQPSINWDSAKIEHNIFERFSQETTNSSAYDMLSIMHYFFPKELTTDGTSFPLNNNLSTIDKEFARQIYPFPPSPATQTGVLLTGDDCDEIEFTVEYNVVHNSEVEFILHPGYDHHNTLVNWWKMIGITQKTGVIAALELYKTIKIPDNTIDKTKPITFGKAKVLGVHTGLGFTWAPWPAIVGGCRVKFVWRRDSCN